MVHLGEPADDRVLFGDDRTDRVELRLQNGKVVLETRHFVRGIVQSLGDVCFSPRVDTPGQRDEAARRDNEGEARHKWLAENGESAGLKARGCGKMVVLMAAVETVLVPCVNLVFLFRRSRWCSP